MASKITNITELFHRFHQCEMQLRQGKIAACLIGFKEVIERSSSIPKTAKEKREFNSSVELFLQNMSAHKKFQEIFGVMSFGDTDLETNLEFIKSMISAQEEEIVERVKKDDESAEIQRLEIDREAMIRQEEIRKQIEQAIAFLDAESQTEALEIIDQNEELREAVATHYNDSGRQHRINQSFSEAISDYSKALAVAPEDENLHYNIGRAHFEAGHTDKAENSLALAMRLNPDFPEGKIFYDYLLKINAPRETAAGSELRPDGFLKKLFNRFRKKTSDQQA